MELLEILSSISKTQRIDVKVEPVKFCKVLGSTFKNELIEVWGVGTAVVTSFQSDWLQRPKLTLPELLEEESFAFNS